MLRNAARGIIEEFNLLEIDHGPAFDKLLKERSGTAKRMICRL
jgi:hypothetical protein